MPGNTYKVTSDSPLPVKKSSDTSSKGKVTSNGVSNGKSSSNGKGGGGGILKKEKKNNVTIVEEKKEKEQWEKNYVPCDLNDNFTSENKSTKPLTLPNGYNSPKPKKKSRSDNHESMVRKVSEIFEEVFKEQRGHWSSTAEYFLSCFAMPIAFSSLWRFPYLIANYGGGAFLFCYILLLLLVGMPLFLMESLLGQFAQLGCVHVWRCVPLMQGVGIATLVLSLITSIYNSQLLAYVVHYFFASFVNTDGLVLWAECKPSWNNCYDVRTANLCSPLNATNELVDNCYHVVSSSSKYYWQEKVLRITELGDIGKTGPIHWDLALCLVFVWISVLVILVRGIKSCGKFAYLSGTVPFAVLVTFLAYVLQMDGAIQGLSAFYTPDWDRLLEPEVWQKAAEQLIFSLSLAYGSAITFSSYKKIRCTAQALPIISTIANLVFSVLAATTVFALMGTLAYNLQLHDPKDLFDSDVSSIELLFTKIPEAMALTLPYPHAWSVFFFLMLLLLGLQSQCALIESSCTTVYDSMPKMRKKKFIVVGCLVIPLLFFSLPLSASTGLHIHRLLETSVIGPNVLLLLVFEIFALQLFYGVRLFSNDCSVIMKKPVSIFWKVCWVFISPLTLIVLLVFVGINWSKVLFEHRREDKEWALYLSWTLTLLPLAMIPITLIFTLFYKLCKKEPVTEPSYLWGPGCPKLREALAEKSEEKQNGSDNAAFNQN